MAKLQPAPWLRARTPALGLALVLLVALGLRWPHLSAPLQTDEFGPAYAVCERASPPGEPPCAADPLRPVPDWQTVRARSILPYGFVQPLPLYHYLLYLLLSFLPITEWSLRLPSLVAGLGCVVAMYRLCRRALGGEAALVAALLVALDPMQVGVSVIARPYAIANLLCIVSFTALFRLREARSPEGAALAAADYGLAVALIGYLNATLLLVGAAHIGLVLFWCAADLTGAVAARRKAATVVATQGMPIAKWVLDALRQWTWAGWWVAGGALAGVLLSPEQEYFRQLHAFQQAHRAFLLDFLTPTPWVVVKHNSTFLVGLALLVVMLVIDAFPWAVYAFRRFAAAATTESGRWRPGPRDPGRPALLACGLCWCLLPQVAVWVLTWLGGRPILLSRYLSYVGLGGMLLLAYGVTRYRDRAAWVPLAAALVLVTFSWGFRGESIGNGLWTEERYGKAVIEQLDRLAAQGQLREGDAVLFRPGFLEGDLLPDDIPVESRAAVEGVLRAQLTTLYAPRGRLPVLTLSFSERLGSELYAAAGRHYDPSRFYNASLAARLRRYSRLWVISHPWDRYAFLQCFLGWFLETSGEDSKVLVHWPTRELTEVPDIHNDRGPNDLAFPSGPGQPDAFTQFTLIVRE
jgi:4-amino-4-deoxy-L-arabinose transferase-like glycosyltransferase